MLRLIACITYSRSVVQTYYGWKQDANDPISNLYDLHVDLFYFVSECIDFNTIIVGYFCNCHIRIWCVTETFLIISYWVNQFNETDWIFFHMGSGLDRECF